MMRNICSRTESILYLCPFRANGVSGRLLTQGVAVGLCT